MVFTKDLVEFAKEIKQDFHNNTPYPHIAIKGLFDETILRNAVQEIGEVTAGDYRSYNDPDQVGKELIEGEALLNASPPNLRKIFTALNSPEFVNFLHTLTGIEGLYADNTFRGGGIHQTSRGGRLGIHVDFSRPKWNRNTYRRANILLYLNDEWQDEWGGHLELWDNSVKNGGKCVNKISPEFNTLAIFGTAKNSWHGHPNPLACPEDRSRLSFASYYYSDTPSDDLEVHNTIFQ